MKRREFTHALTTVVLLSRGAPAAAQPAEGREFTRLQPPQPVQAGAGRIEVLEFFSYACPHCNAFEPDLEAWARKLPADVVLRRVPVPFLYNAENFQRTYFALETMGLVATLQPKIFAAVHVEHLRLATPGEIAALVAKNGGDAAKFLDVFRSFSVDRSVKQARQMTSDFGVDTGPGVPTLAVQGRWLTSPAQAGGARQALAVADWLIERARKG